MNEADPIRMKQLPPDSVSSRCVDVRFFASVGLVSDNRTSDACEMNPYLMHPAGLQYALDHAQAVIGSGWNEPIMRDGPLSTDLIDPDLILFLRSFQPEDFRGYCPLGMRRGGSGDCKISFPDRPFLKLGKQRIESFLRLCDDHDSGGVLVDPVDERRLESEGIMPFSKIIVHELDERELFRLIISGVDDDSGVLVDDEDTPVFINDVLLQDSLRALMFRSGRILGTKHFEFIITQEDPHFIVFQEPIFILYPCIADLDSVFPVQLVDERQARVREELLKEFVEPLTGIVL